MPDVSRRDFVKVVSAVAMAPALGAAPAETPVARLYASLSVEQKVKLCFPFDHPLKTVFRDNWKIVEPTIGDLDKKQQALCREVFQSVCTDEGLERFDRQMREDDGGFAKYHVALFGQPGTDKPFEWVLTGRHVTLRADGNHTQRVGFGGPIFYGHGAPVDRDDSNVWWSQCLKANALLATFNGKQRAQALVTKAQAGRARVALLRGQNHPADIGLSVVALDARQKTMIRGLLQELIRPFRGFDAAEVLSCLNTDAGTDALRLSFYEEAKLGPGDVRPVWKLEGPAFAWYFHGTPHVHAWLTLERPGRE